MKEDLVERTLARIALCEDATDLHRTIVNADRHRNSAVAEAARRRLYHILPLAAPGTLEFDVWRSIHALEETLSVERGKTVRLSRTRQKVARDGEIKTVADLVLGKPTDGFDLLIARRMDEYTFESVALRHGDMFDVTVLETARRRLSKLAADA